MTATLVQYGINAFVGRFTGVGEHQRGDAVVVRTPRGVELGTVLCPADEHVPLTWDADAGGELLRAATPADGAVAQAHAQVGRDILAAAEADAADLPLTFLDAEVLLDGSAAVLHALPWGECNADDHLARWSARFGLAVRLLDVTRLEVAPEPVVEAKSGCSSCGSGSGGCSSCGSEKSGCSTGGCSRGAAKTADEMTDYFADLRRKMEAETATRRPLV
jgi:hypothetical protein